MTQSNTLILEHAEAVSWRGQFLRDVVHGLERPEKSLPCKYFYDAVGSTLFDEICDLDEYYLTRTELQILRAHVSEMAETIGEDCDLIELGSGSALKTRLLLEQLPSPRSYQPIDISGGHLEKSARDLARSFPALKIMPIHADFTASFELRDSGDPRARRVVYFPGSTIGNFSPKRALHLLEEIADLVGPGGGLLIGFDLDKDESIVWPAYNDSQGKSAAFNLNLLARINRELGANFDLSAFSHRAVYLRAEERMVMSLVSHKSQVVRLPGREFSFRENEAVHTEDSYKYSLNHFAHLTSLAGFTVERQWFDARKYFAVQYLIAF